MKRTNPQIRFEFTKYELILYGVNVAISAAYDMVKSDFRYCTRLFF